jgi:hypothetical protein
MAEPRPARFGWRPGELEYSQCVDCRHKHTTGPTCTAFPEGIPEVILQNGHDHREPYPGDHGIHFERDEDEPR